MKRREFLKKTLYWILSGTAAAAFAYPVAVFTTFRKAKTRDLVFEAKDLLGEISFKEEVFVSRQGEDLVALSGRCSHLGCLVNFNPVSRRFECPCHGSAYDLKGRRLSGPTAKDLEILPLERKPDGQVMVTVKARL